MTKEQKMISIQGEVVDEPQMCCWDRRGMPERELTCILYWQIREYLYSHLRHDSTQFMGNGEKFSLLQDKWPPSHTWIPFIDIEPRTLFGRADMIIGIGPYTYVVEVKRFLDMEIAKTALKQVNRYTRALTDPDEPTYGHQFARHIEKWTPIKVVAHGGRLGEGSESYMACSKYLTENGIDEIWSYDPDECHEGDISGCFKRTYFRGDEIHVVEPSLSSVWPMTCSKCGKISPTYQGLNAVG